MTRPAYREVELDLRVTRREDSADGVVTLTLTDPSGSDLPEWTPGAHIDLVMTPELVRQYSLCGDTTNRSEWRVGVLLDPASRGGSEFVHNKLHEGSTIRVRGPRNHFGLVSAPRYRFIAKKELARIPIFGRAAGKVAAIWIDRRNRKAAFDAYRDAAEEVRGGVSVVVFPEGTRGVEYTLRPFKKGPFVLAIAAHGTIAYAAFYAAAREHPHRYITLRHDDRILSRWSGGH